MQKRNEKKKLVCGRNGNLKISSVLHTAGTLSVRYAKMPSSSKRKKEEKKRKRGNPHKSSERTLGVFVVMLLYMTKKEQKENVQKKGLTRIRTGVTRSYSISVHCRTFSKSGMLTTTS